MVLCTPAAAQDAIPSPVRAAVTVVPPFVLEENGAPTGFNIELWDTIASKLKLKTDYENLPDVEALELALRQNKADVIVSPKVLTLIRVKDFDVSVPILQLGLQILVLDTGEVPRRGTRLLHELASCFADRIHMARHSPAPGSRTRPSGVAAGTAPERWDHFQSFVLSRNLPRHLLGVGSSGHSGGEDAA